MSAQASERIDNNAHRQKQKNAMRSVEEKQTQRNEEKEKGNKVGPQACQRREKCQC
jgi:hypothetical protein